MDEVRPSDQMRNLGVVQQGAPILAERARPFSLPADHDAAEQAVERLFTSIERIAQVHTFAKGMGIAAARGGGGGAGGGGSPPDRYQPRGCRRPAPPITVFVAPQRGYRPSELA